MLGGPERHPACLIRSAVTFKKGECFLFAFVEKNAKKAVSGDRRYKQYHSGGRYRSGIEKPDFQILIRLLIDGISPFFKDGKPFSVSGRDEPVFN